MKRTVWQNCHVATMRDGHWNALLDAAIITDQGRISWVGPRRELTLPHGDGVDDVDLEGAWVTPGLIDCHTHTVFGGNRSGEFEQRLEGVSYADIAAAGGGIAGTVRQTREAHADELLTSASRRLRHLLSEGVTVVEIKSGYGLDLVTERRMLQVARRLGERLPVTVRTTCLAAHAIAPEYAGRPQDYVDHICEVMLPALISEGLVDAVDGFCEVVALSVTQCEQVLKRAQELGVAVKLHTEQLTSSGGAGMAARLGALSVDHLEYLQEADIVTMAQHGTVAVLLPGAYHMLREKQSPPVSMLRKHGVPMALASDLNPGTSPALSLRLMMNFGCVLFGMTPEEAVAGVTLHAAQALGMQSTHGSIETGKVADFVAWQIDRPVDLVYWLGGQIPHLTIRHGMVRSLPTV
ncbi:MAG: imidazolonepropionase [Lautropia sp.]|nr:imidazolonepropionase [Lautropia sp.]